MRVLCRDAEWLVTKVEFSNYAHTHHAVHCVAKLDYGQENGFTCHSLRHTFITDLMEKTGGDAGTVMAYSGHKSLESFSNYLHPTEKGCKLAIQALENVALFLRSFEGQEGNQGQEGQKKDSVKPLQSQELAV
jgi:integrase